MTRIRQLRAHAISQTLFRPRTLRAAIDRLGFVQADPIRSPARAQDLILRHRVESYRVGDLERRYAGLDIEEDMLYAYGFLPRRVWELLHPRKITDLSEFQKKVLEAVRDTGPIHPRALDAHFKSERVLNAWGGFSKATKRALEALHRRGLLRIACRENGIRIYQPISPPIGTKSTDERFRELVRVVGNILAPVNEKFLLRIAAYFKYLIPGVAGRRKILRELIESGEFQRRKVDGLAYVWPVFKRIYIEPPRRVRILAPFDPLVRDRERFEHLWKWSYRFEAYTPPAKRHRGYYAMPLLWIDQVVGWANANVVERKLKVETGFVGQPPKDRDFLSELEAEVSRLAGFLRLDDDAWELKMLVP